MRCPALNDLFLLYPCLCPCPCPNPCPSVSAFSTYPKNVSAGNTNHCSVIICTSMIYYIYCLVVGMCTDWEGIEYSCNCSLASLVGLTGFLVSPSTVQVDGTDWSETVLIWECVCMPTGSGKSPLCCYIAKILEEI